MMAWVAGVLMVLEDLEGTDHDAWIGLYAGGDSLHILRQTPCLSQTSALHLVAGGLVEHPR